MLKKKIAKKIVWCSEGAAAPGAGGHGAPKSIKNGLWASKILATLVTVCPRRQINLLCHCIHPSHHHTLLPSPDYADCSAFINHVSVPHVDLQWTENRVLMHPHSNTESLAFSPIIFVACLYVVFIIDTIYSSTPNISKPTDHLTKISVKGFPQHNRHPKFFLLRL